MRGSIFVRSAALLVFGLFVAIGGSALIASIEPFHSTMPLGGEASTDQFLGILGVPHPAAKLEEQFRHWQPNSTFLFIAPANEDFWRQTYYTMAYLAHPRLISAMACAEGNAGQEEIHQEKSPNIDGLIFFEIPPGRWRTDARPIGAKLYFAHFHGSAAWKSFCP